MDREGGEEEGRSVETLFSETNLYLRSLGLNIALNAYVKLVFSE